YHTRHDPFLMKDMDAAVSRILSAFRSGETICVWHDYDCDGIPGGALLHDFFKKIGHAVQTYVPERNEGYGLNEGGIRALKDAGVSLIITVDCGITDVSEVALAKELGIDVIITDHHLPCLAEASGEGGARDALPDACAVVNPHRADDTYPFKGLCGTGVAFKLVEALIIRGDFGISAGWEKWLLDLVALATIADMVPLTGENRALVHYGLKVVRKGRRPGLTAIFEREKIPLEFATEDDLSFSVAPKINAASRMGSPRLAFELLTTDSPERARELAETLEALNKERKIEGMHLAKDVKRKIESMPVLPSIVVAGSRSWRPSLLSIAASSVVETYGKTVFLWGMDPSPGTGQAALIKGSCRSDGSVNVVALMSAVRDLFLDFGGHELAGGFSLAPEAVHTLAERLEKALAEMTAAVPAGTAAVGEPEPEDSLTLSEITDSAFDALRTLAPFGEANPKPVFRFRNVSVSAINFFGPHKDHVKLSLSDDSFIPSASEGQTINALAFFFSRASFKDTLALLSAGDRVTVHASLERSHFRGKKELRLRVVDLRVA
ncbi:single-stranded-DNA-specific exonuclease RecJ, partial [Candidatus Kaiserbacteria bacterium]|nr:single-stranded-DNA-specific exonuclease RecJ [Candidatus Kaiserbacteria bacterium]